MKTLRIAGTYRTHWTTPDAVEALAFATGEQIVMGDGFASIKVEGVVWCCPLAEAVAS